MVQLDCARLSSREVGARLAALAAELAANPGAPAAAGVEILNPHAMHNFAVGLKGKLRIVVRGSLGSYAGGFMNGPHITVTANSGWYTGDNMMGGTIVVEGNSGSNVAPSMIDGTIHVRGSAGNRVGYGLKGGTVVIEGRAGFETGKMLIGGRLVLLSGVGRQVGESMYQGFIHIHGPIESVGGNVEAGEPPSAEKAALQQVLDDIGCGLQAGDFTTLMPRPGKHKYVLFQPRHQVGSGGKQREAGVSC